MSDLALFVIGLLVSFLCLGGILIHVIIGAKVGEVSDKQLKDKSSHTN